MRIRTAGAIAGGAAAAIAAAVATYPVLWRRWCLTWARQPVKPPPRCQATT